MGYIYAVMWLVAGIMMLVNFRKLNPLVVPVSIYFLFLSGWWFANELLPVDLMHGGYAWIMRGISAAVIVLCILIYYSVKKKRVGKQDDDGDNGGQDE